MRDAARRKTCIASKSVGVSIVPPPAGSPSIGASSGLKLKLPRPTSSSSCHGVLVAEIAGQVRFASDEVPVVGRLTNSGEAL